MGFSVRSALIMAVVLPIAGQAVRCSPAAAAPSASVQAQTDRDSETTAAAPADASAGPQAPVAADPSVPTAQEREYVALINRDRLAHGLGTLDVDPLLVQVARQHSREMCERDYFDHFSPTAGIRTPLDRYVKAMHDGNCDMPDYALVGENIFYCSRIDGKYNVAYGHNALMNSPHHRENILEPKFQKVGVGLFINASGAVWVTEVFLRDVPVDTPVASRPRASTAGSVATAP